MKYQTDGFGYDEACNLINDLPKFTAKHSIEESKSFLNMLGNPEKDFRIIHVAGTNGKGSVCVYMESILINAGFSTGCFISPHLEEMRERVRLCGEMCSKDDFAWACEIVKNTAEKSFYPSFFEFLFFIALLIFKKNNIELLILETGLGGRLDATNLIEKKELSVITSIGLDHMEYLGDTVEDIAYEKAGIMRENTPVVYWKKLSTDAEKTVSDKLHECAGKKGAEEYAIEPGVCSDIIINKAGIDFCLNYTYHNCVRLELPTKAKYQVENAALAVISLMIWDKEKRLENKNYSDGLLIARWEGRMEEIADRIILDGAHNVPGTEAFLDSVKLDGASKRMLIYACMCDKQYIDEVKLIAASKLFNDVIAVPMEYGRALPADELAECFMAEGLNAKAAATQKEAIELAYQYTINEANYVYIAGSLYLIGELRGLFV